MQGVHMFIENSPLSYFLRASLLVSRPPVENSTKHWQPDLVLCVGLALPSVGMDFMMVVCVLPSCWLYTQPQDVCLNRFLLGWGCFLPPGSPKHQRANKNLICLIFLAGNTRRKEGKTFLAELVFFVSTAVCVCDCVCLNTKLSALLFRRIPISAIHMERTEL